MTLRIGAIAQADIDAALLPPDDVVDEAVDEAAGEWHDVAQDDNEAPDSDADAQTTTSRRTPTPGTRRTPQWRPIPRPDGRCSCGRPPVHRWTGWPPRTP